MLIQQDGKKYFTVGYSAYEIPDTRFKAFFKGKLFNYSESIESFLKSSKTTCIVPVYCEEVSEKRAFKRVTIETYTEHYNFTNSEKGQYSYYRNEIKDIEKGNAYFIFLEKFARARNDCLIKAAMKIDKIERDESASGCFIGNNIEAMIEEMDKILSDE